MSATYNPRRKSNMRNFGKTEGLRLPRSTFDISKPWKGTFDQNTLVPFYLQEGLPGDTFRVRLHALARLNTPLRPFMDNLYLDFHFWWVPNRQVWENWEKLMGEQENPGDSIDFLVPQVGVDSNGPNAFASEFGSMGDFMGVPPRAAAHVTASYTVSALPARCYNRIWHFHYRDQNLQEAPALHTGDAQDPSLDYPLRARGKRFDYLTAALPFQQKGDPAPLALGGLAPITGIGIDQPSANQNTNVNVRETGKAAAQTYNWTSDAAGGGAAMFFQTGPGAGENPAIYADLGIASGVTVTQLRYSVAIQHVLERDARGGTRYPEILMSRFGVRDPQLLVLQRPEYLGGGSQLVSISPVPNTSATTDENQGDLAAVGTASVDGIGFTRSFTEHGFVLGLVSARADLTYQQGVERMWSRRERFDFYHPELAHVSEQAIEYKEIYVTGDPAQDEATWGYIGAYDEYRFGMSLITSQFRSSHPTSLDFWHLSQFFGIRPTLGDDFIQDDPPLNRVVQVPAEPKFIMDCFVHNIAARPLPVTGIPGLSRL